MYPGPEDGIWLTQADGATERGRGQQEPAGRILPTCPHHRGSFDLHTTNGTAWQPEREQSGDYRIIYAPNRFLERCIRAVQGLDDGTDRMAPFLRVAPDSAGGVRKKKDGPQVT
jgi:hypothetical protein